MATPLLEEIRHALIDAAVAQLSQPRKPTTLTKTVTLKR